MPPFPIDFYRFFNYFHSKIKFFFFNFGLCFRLCCTSIFNLAGMNFGRILHITRFIKCGNIHQWRFDIQSTQISSQNLLFFESWYYPVSGEFCGGLCSQGVFQRIFVFGLRETDISIWFKNLRFYKLFFLFISHFGGDRSINFCPRGHLRAYLSKSNVTAGRKLFG